MAKSLAPDGVVDGVVSPILQPLVNKDLDGTHYKTVEGAVQAEVGGRP
jgi:hypothetical protein